MIDRERLTDHVICREELSNPSSLVSGNGPHNACVLDRNNVLTDCGVPLLALSETVSFSTTFIYTLRFIQPLIW